MCSKEEKDMSIKLLETYSAQYQSSNSNQSVKTQADHFKTLGNEEFRKEN